MPDIPQDHYIICGKEKNISGRPIVIDFDKGDSSDTASEGKDIFESDHEKPWEKSIGIILKIQRKSAFSENMVTEKPENTPFDTRGCLDLIREGERTWSIISQKSE